MVKRKVKRNNRNEIGGKEYICKRKGYVNRNEGRKRSGIEEGKEKEKEERLGRKKERKQEQRRKEGQN